MRRVLVSGLMSALLTVLVVAGLTSLAMAQQTGSAPQGAKPGALVVETVT